MEDDDRKRVIEDVKICEEWEVESENKNEDESENERER